MAGAFLRVFISTLGFFVLASPFLVSILASSSLTLSLSLLVSGGVFLLALFWPRSSLFFLGLCFCLLPALGAHVLPFFILCWLLGFFWKTACVSREVLFSEGPSRVFALFGALCLLTPLFLSGFSTFLQTLDEAVMSAVWNSGGMEGLYFYLAAGGADWIRALRVINATLIAVLFMFTIPSLHVFVPGLLKNGALRLIFLGISISVLIATFIGCLQIFDIHPIFSAHRGDFWKLIGRYNATFTDPNALGVVGVLLIPVLFFLADGKSRNNFRLEAVLFFLILPWSGSRTFWLGLLLWVMLYPFLRIREQKSKTKLKKKIFLFLPGFLFVSGLVLVGYPEINDSLREQVKIPAMERVVKSLHWERGAQSISSRVLYIQIATQVWRESPLIGVGLGRFYGAQEGASQRAGVNLKGWRDNANNYYLHVLAEQGLLGLAFLFLSFYLFARALSGAPLRFANEYSIEADYSPRRVLTLSRAALCVLLVLFLTGPHIEFSEVLFLAAFLLGMGVANVRHLTTKNSIRFWTRTVIGAGGGAFFVFLGVFFFASPSQKSFGFYGIEERDGISYRWTTKRSGFSLCNGSQDPLRIKLQASHPEIQTRPVNVSVTRMDVDNPKIQEIQNISLKDNSWVELTLPVLSSEEDVREALVFEVDYLWSPRELQGSLDSRFLGVQLLWPKEACEQL